MFVSNLKLIHFFHKGLTQKNDVISASRQSSGRYSRYKAKIISKSFTALALLSHNKLRFLQDEICNNQKKYNTRNNEKSSNLRNHRTGRLVPCSQNSCCKKDMKYTAYCAAHLRSIPDASSTCISMSGCAT